jgi:N-acetylglucosaminyl-diphospho-decaprenol L-rhamnosyltransferase
MIKFNSIVSFIIPNWNQRQLIYECVSSIKKTISNISHDIIIVDNASTDGSAEYIKKNFSDVLWIQNDINHGYAKAINQGVELSQGDFLFLLNNDIKLLENATERLVSFLIENPDAGAVAPLLYYPDGRLQISCRRFPTPMAILLEKLNINKIGPFRRLKLTPKEHLAGGEVLQPMASALMVKRECWNAMCPIDEEFPIFFNDVDWCYRLYKDTNYKIYLCPEAKAIHHEGVSTNLLGHRKKIEFYKGLIRFYFKHFPFKAGVIKHDRVLKHEKGTLHNN